MTSSLKADQASSLFAHGMEYWIDAAQRAFLFTDILRKRGNEYLEHIRAGQPPVLAFDYEIVKDGKTLYRPVNFQLVRIKDRRTAKKRISRDIGENRRADTTAAVRSRRRPIVVMDPRAGHGPGIGGSKMDSQIGIALNAGHPVYFIMFLPEPVSGQTIADVQQCQVFFLEEVAQCHPRAMKPAVIGNCQAGWAAALIAADRPDVTGPLVLNGSPLSYWGGVKGANPMRYRGGLFGGSWLASLASDIGNGQFDGAHLVAGFEDLNAANTFWTKLYNVYSKVDTEENRFLDFEKWWGGFYLLSREEIRFIVNNLFISDELEQGFLRLSKGSYINLKNFKDPILVFASKGDNITPPQQALNWISKVYKSVEEIKKYGQTIVYLLHDSVGHLGIFVSSRVTRKEHREIIGCLDAIDFLAPGLYEMVIKEGPSRPWLEDHHVAFVERSMGDILALDDGFEDEEAFYPVAAVSKFNDKLYQDSWGPWIRMVSNGVTAEALRQLHPLRLQRYAGSDLNPWMAPVSWVAGLVRQNRFPVKENNWFTLLEKTFSDQITHTLAFYQKSRDALYEALFYTLYGNLWMKTLFFDQEKQQRSETVDQGPEKSEMFKALEDQLWSAAMKKGGFQAAVVRIILAVTGANYVFAMAEYDAAKMFMKTDPRLRQIEPDRLKSMIRDQAAILEKDQKAALNTIKDLIPGKEDRKAALDIAAAIADIQSVKRIKKAAMLRQLEKILLPPVL